MTARKSQTGKEAQGTGGRATPTTPGGKKQGPDGAASSRTERKAEWERERTQRKQKRLKQEDQRRTEQQLL